MRKTNGVNKVEVRDEKKDIQNRKKIGLDETGRKGSQGAQELALVSGSQTCPHTMFAGICVHDSTLSRDETGAYSTRVHDAVLEI